MMITPFTGTVYGIRYTCGHTSQAGKFVDAWADSEELCPQCRTKRNIELGYIPCAVKTCNKAGPYVRTALGRNTNLCAEHQHLGHTSEEA